MDHISYRSLTPGDLTNLLVRLIELAAPESNPRALQIRAYASTLAFFKSFDVEEVREAAQWSSSFCSVTRYLQVHLETVPCVAMGSAP